MSDLISRSEYASKLVKVLDVLNKEYREALLNEDYELINAIQNQQGAYTIALRVLDNQPTAYDVDKVAEELEKQSKPLGIGFIPDERYIKEKKAIEIVKQGGVSNRKDCEYRHENGNCLKVGGFCTSVDDKHGEKMKHGVVSDDVCEWNGEQSRLVTFTRFTTACGDNIDLQTNSELLKAFRYCPYCGKKIKVVE